ncbi:hypothetical protein RISK_003042 [Rhodopirellula islandica]|uniref:Uncharacterized protein n=1 Tax=Rhodopirellula islandica TaxID=595434 RepID=A0A0J1EGV4_RHOIS|nr:hypothetical protein RISK_003042 [Rhodopirellula islandica]
MRITSLTARLERADSAGRADDACSVGRKSKQKESFVLLTLCRPSVCCRDLLANAATESRQLQFLFASTVGGGFDLAWQPVTIGDLEKF